MALRLQASGRARAMPPANLAAPRSCSGQLQRRSLQAAEYQSGAFLRKAPV